MSISLVEVAGANFRTDRDSDELNTEFMNRLGMRKRFLPARLAIARSLAINIPVELLPKDVDRGKVIKGDTLFGIGTTLSVWLTLIVEHIGEADIDLNQLLAFVAAHWKRGLMKLDEEWQQSNEDVPQFVKRLVEVADLPNISMSSRDSDQEQTDIPEAISSIEEIKVLLGEVGEDVASGEPVLWSLNGKGGSPHSAIMGGSGSGKTVMATAMLRAIREQTPVPLLAFDFKGDLAGYSGTKKQSAFGDAFGAKVIEPPRMPIPLDVLSLQKTDAISIDGAALQFRDSFSRLKGSRMGDLQRGRIYEAAKEALSGNKPCQLKHILDCLNKIYEDDEIKKDGAITSMEELCRFPYFQPEFSPKEFFQKSWIIKLPTNLSQDIKMITVNLLLNALDQYLNSLDDMGTNSEGARGLRILCMIDEAHQILGTKLPSLSNLIRMSRSKGGAVMLISQSPDDFSGEDSEFLDNMGLVAAFATNAKPGATKRILGSGAKLTGLENGQCFARVDKTTKKVKVW